MGSKKKKGSQEARAEPTPKAISKSISYTITTDHGDQVHIAQPKHPKGKAKSGYTCWAVAISRASRMLPHDTEDASAFMLRVVDHITRVYNGRKTAHHGYEANPKVMGMQARLKLIHNLFKIDPSPGGPWAAKLPDQAEVYALAFSARGCKLNEATGRFFELWGISDWARVPCSSAANGEAAGPAPEGEAAPQKMRNGEDAKELEARVSRLEAELETDATSHQAAREEDRAQINQLINVVARLCAQVDQIYNVTPPNEVVDAALRGEAVSPADLLHCMAESAYSCKQGVELEKGVVLKKDVEPKKDGEPKYGVEPRAGNKRKRGAGDAGEHLPNPFADKRKRAAGDGGEHPPNPFAVKW